MSGETISNAEPDSETADTWPWRCLDCGSTIYHDVEFCRDCSSEHRVAEGQTGRDAPGGFASWVRRQTAPALAVKVTAIASIELALTTVWLRVAFRASLGLDAVVQLA